MPTVNSWHWCARYIFFLIHIYINTTIKID